MTGGWWGEGPSVDLDRDDLAPVRHDVLERRTIAKLDDRERRQAQDPRIRGVGAGQREPGLPVVRADLPLPVDAAAGLLHRQLGVEVYGAHAESLAGEVGLLSHRHDLGLE